MPGRHDGLRLAGHHDLVIIGTGAAAFSAAVRARELERTVLMIEQGVLGGTCVNTGCIPSKSLLAAARAAHLAARAPFPGVDTVLRGRDFAAAVAGARDIADQLRRERYEAVLDTYAIDLMQGVARFVSPDEVTVGGVVVEAEAYLVASGSVTHVPAVHGLRDVGFLTSQTLLDVRQLPGSVLVIGGNYIGVEHAQLLRRMGVTRVVVAEAMDHLMPGEEPEAADALAGALRAEDIEIFTGAVVTAVQRGRHGQLRATLWFDEASHEVEVEQVLVAAGRDPLTHHLNLDRAGIATDARAAITVDAAMRTTNRKVWAAGDCTGAPMHTYVAAQGGRIAAGNAVDGREEHVDWSALPRIVFADPPLAAAGLTHEQALRAGHDCTCHVLFADAAARPWVERDHRGLVKIVAESTSGRVLGVTMVMQGADHAILAAELVVRHGLTVADLASSWSPYLTSGELMRLGAQSFTRSLPALSCCA